MLFWRGQPFTSIRQNTLQLVEAKPRFIRLNHGGFIRLEGLSAGIMAEAPLRSFGELYYTTSC